MTIYDKTTKYNDIKKKISSRVAIESEKVLIDYMVYFSNIDELFTDIDKLQKESKNLFAKLQITILNSEKIEIEYKNKIFEIETNIENVRQLFSLKKDICKKYSNVHDIKIIQNMYRQKLNKFESIITNHQNLKSKHIEFYKMLNKQHEFFNIETPENDKTQNNMNNTCEQSQEYNHDVEIFIERNREIELLVKSITELSRIFKDLSIMVNEQSEIIDRIDIIMSDVVEKTQDGVKELKSAQEKQKKCVIQ